MALKEEVSSTDEFGDLVSSSSRNYDSKEEGLANRYNFAYLLHKHHAKAAKQHLSRNQHQELAVRFFP